MVHVSENSPTHREDRVEVRIYNTGTEVRVRAAVAVLTLLLIALGAGAGFFIGVVSVIAGKTLSGVNWNTILIALGTLCFGFGCASILFQMYRWREATALHQQYESLRVRAHELSERFKEYENRKRSP